MGSEEGLLVLVSLVVFFFCNAYPSFNVFFLRWCGVRVWQGVKLYNTRTVLRGCKLRRQR